MIEAFFQWIGTVALGLAIVGIVDSRAAKLYGSAWFAWIDGKAALAHIFKDSFRVYKDSEGVNTPATWSAE